MQSFARHRALSSPRSCSSRASSGAAPTQRRFRGCPGVRVDSVDVPRPDTSQQACTGFPATSPSPNAPLRCATSGSSRTCRAVDQSSARSSSQRWRGVGEQIPENDPFFELFVAALDRTRVWWGDLEADVADGNDVYASVLAEWARYRSVPFSPIRSRKRGSRRRDPWRSASRSTVRTSTLRPNTSRTGSTRASSRRSTSASPPPDASSHSSRRSTRPPSCWRLDQGERAALEARGWCFE